MRTLFKNKINLQGYKKVKLVMDRGYYSADNINGLYKQHYKFLVGANTTLSYAKAFIKELGDDIRNLPIGFLPIGFPHHGQNCFAQDARKSEMSGVSKSSSITSSLTYSKVCRALAGSYVAEIQLKPRQFRARKNRREGACFHVFLRFRYVNLYLPGRASTPGL